MGEGWEGVDPLPQAASEDTKPDAAGETRERLGSITPTTDPPPSRGGSSLTICEYRSLVDAE
jgi:hypothetical protein